MKVYELLSESTIPWKMTKAEYEKDVPLKPSEFYWIAIGGGKQVEVALNPSSNDLSAMTKEVKKQNPSLRPDDVKLRHTQDADGNKYYWNAYDAIHSQIEPILSKKVGTELNQNRPKDSHRRVVGQALMAGKPVPNDVLNDYPDLRSYLKQ